MIVVALFGGYPGAAALRHDESCWLRYIRSSLIAPSIANDALVLDDVRKPELMRRLFDVGALYSGQEVSYRKLLGQLDDRGNAATMVHYLHLLGAAGMLSGLQKYDGKLLRQRSSSPRLMVHNTALMTVAFGRNRSKLLTDPEVDFVVSSAEALVAVEVKSGRVKHTGGLTRFVIENPRAKTLVVGSPGCSVERFLLGETDLF